MCGSSSPPAAPPPAPAPAAQAKPMGSPDNPGSLTAPSAADPNSTNAALRAASKKGLRIDLVGPAAASGTQGGLAIPT